LRRFLRQRLTLDEARRIVQERMEQRETNFLRIVERSVYGSPRSPYLPLLQGAGCELGDLRAIVKQKGLEGALREQGVYITYEEFKGRKPIVRNGTTIPVKASDFDNPFARRDFTSQTGGSTGLATNVALSLDYFAARASYQKLFLSAYDVMNAPTAYWLAIFPGSGFEFILQRTDLREPIHRWFSYLGWRDSTYWLKYDLATLYIRLYSK
jgi:hypothetical protein